ncbi:MAG: hypothetical protein ACKV22_07350 [Bryobacteraceae bacterium]
MTHRTIACATLLLLGSSATLRAQPQCSAEQLRGKWSIATTGSALPTAPGPWTVGQTVPVVGAAVVTIDHNGNFTGPGSIVLGGAVLDYEMTGTFAVNSDCAGLMKYTVKLKGLSDVIPGYVERFILDLTHEEIVSVSIQSPLSKPMWLSVMKRISHVPSPVAWPDVTP